MALFPAFGAEYVVDSSNYTTVISGLTGEHTVRFENGTYSGHGTLEIQHPLTLTSNTGDYRTSGVVFTGESTLRVRSNGVSVKGFRFENANSTFGNAQILVDLSDSTANVLIEKNSFNNTKGGGVQVEGNGDNPGTAFVNVAVVDNYFGGIGFNGNLTAEGNKHTAILFSVVDDSVIRGNVINRTTWTGINLDVVSNVLVENNTVYNTSKNGIQVARSPESNVNLTGNTVMFANSDRTRIQKESYRKRKNVLGDALRLENITVDGTNDNNSLVRMVDANVKAAVSIDGSSEVRIEDNVITHNHDGIIICPSDCAISNYSYHYANYGGLYPGTDALIRNNVIHSNAGADGGVGSNTGRDLITGFENQTVDARYNYWGTNRPDYARWHPYGYLYPYRASSHLAGNILTTPHYTTADGYAPESARAAGLPGDEMVLPAGVYRDVSIFIFQRSPVSSLVADTGDYRTSGAVFTGQSWLEVRDSDNVSVRGFRFENVQTPFPVTSARCTKPINPGDYNYTHMRNFVLEKNKFLNTSNNAFDGPRQDNCHRSGFLIADNLFEGIGYNMSRDDPNNARSAFKIHWLQNSTITNNVIKGTTFQGINLGFNLFNLTISNNSVSGTAHSGIQVHHAMESEVNIVGNVIRNANMDLTVAHLECYRQNLNGFLSSQGAVQLGVIDVIDAKDINTGKNSFNYDVWGKFANNGSPGNVGHCRSGLNTTNQSAIRMLVANVEAAVMVDGASDVFIRGNTITDNHNGIVVCPSYCSISNNSVQLNEWRALNYSTHAVIEGNTIHSNEGRNARGYDAYVSMGIENKTGYDVISQGRLISANGNYWGETESPDSNLSGNVTQELPLSRSPADEKSSTAVGSNDSVSSDAPAVFDFAGEPDAVVRNVTLNVNQAVENVTVVAAVLESMPVSQRLPSSRRTYAYLEIVDTVNESATESATVTFAVPQEWLRSNRVNKDTVLLLRVRQRQMECFEH